MKTTAVVESLSYYKTNVLFQRIPTYFKNKVLPPYVNSPCHKVTDAGNSTSSFSISAILHSCILGYSCFLSANILIISWHPSIIFVGLFNIGEMELLLYIPRPNNPTYLQDLRIPIQARNLYNKIVNKVLSCYVKFPCHKVAQHMNSTSSYSLKLFRQTLRGRCWAVSPSSPKQYFQLSSANTTQNYFLSIRESHGLTVQLSARLYIAQCKLMLTVTIV